MTAKGYLRSGSSYQESDGGDTEIQIWDVEVNARERDFYRVARRDGRVPKKGEHHRDEPSLVVQRRTISDLGGGKARIVVEYGVPTQETDDPPGTIIDVRYDGTVFQETTKTDIHGEPIISGSRAFAVGVNVPAPIIEVDRIESSAPGFTFLDRFVKHVNSTLVSGFPARTLLMQAPRSRRVRATGNFVVTYVMWFKAETWDTTLDLVDIETVEFKTTATAFTPGFERFGIKSITVIPTTYQVYAGAEFNALALVF